MDVPTEIITGAVIAGTGLLLGNSGSLIRLHQLLKGHIEDEEADRADLKTIKSRLRRVERKLPNGEIQLMYEMLKSLYKAQVGTMGDLGPKIAQVEREVILEKARQTREETDDAI